MPYDGMPINDSGLSIAEKLRIRLERIVDLANKLDGLAPELVYWQAKPQPYSARVTAIINAISSAQSSLQSRIDTLRTEMENA